MGVFLSTPSTLKFTERGEDDEVDYAATSMQGWRKNMEDAHVAQLDLPAGLSPLTSKGSKSPIRVPRSPRLGSRGGSPTSAGKDAHSHFRIFGVFDGHGGKEVAKYAEAHIAEELIKLEEYKAGDYGAALKRVFLRIDERLRDTASCLRELEEYKKLKNPSDMIGGAVGGGIDDDDGEEEEEDHDDEDDDDDGGGGGGGDAGRGEGHADDEMNGGGASVGTGVAYANGDATVGGGDGVGGASRQSKRRASDKNMRGGGKGKRGGAAGGLGRAAGELGGETGRRANADDDKDSSGVLSASEALDLFQNFLQMGNKQEQAADSDDCEMKDDVKDPSTSSSSSSSCNNVSCKKDDAAEVVDDSKGSAKDEGPGGDDDVDLSADVKMAEAKEQGGGGGGSGVDAKGGDDDDVKGLTKTMASDRSTGCEMGEKNNDDVGEDRNGGGGGGGGDGSKDRGDIELAVGGGAIVPVPDNKDEGNNSNSFVTADAPPSGAVGGGGGGDGRILGSGIQRIGIRELFGFDAQPGQVCDLADHPVQAGCTSIVALLANNRLYVANAGDSRAVLCRNGKAVALSEDHKPSQERELKRIERAGGFVTQAGRINGNLNLSRSLGDLKYKNCQHLPPEEQMITADPDIMEMELKPEDQFMLIACDGVWDIMTNEAAVNFVLARLKTMSTTHVVEELLDACIADDPRRSNGLGGDNMTAILVIFKNNTAGNFINTIKRGDFLKKR